MKFYPSLLFLPIAFAFDTLVHTSLQNIRKMSLARGIDNSHNHVHSKEVLYYAKELMKDVPLSDRQKKIVILGSLYHDMNDHKYPPQDLERLILEMQEVEKDLDIITRTIFFMENMSFSKTVKYCDGGLQYTVPSDVEKCKDFICFDIIRNADLLASYNLRRAFEYRLHKNPQSSVETMVEEVHQLFLKRMGNLRSCNILSLQYERCNVLSERFHKLCAARLKTYTPLPVKETLDYFEIYPHETIEKICQELK